MQLGMLSIDHEAISDVIFPDWRYGYVMNNAATWFKYVKNYLSSFAPTQNVKENYLTFIE